MMQNLTEFPAFDLAAIPLMNGCDFDVVAIEQEMQAMPPSTHSTSAGSKVF